MTEICINNPDLMQKGMRLTTFVLKLEEFLDKYEVGNEDERHKKAWINIAKEMINTRLAILYRVKALYTLISMWICLQTLTKI
jgi:hypothetical protein